MDSVSRFEFGKIFDRVSHEVELESATTALAINNRMKVEIHRDKNKAKQAKVRIVREYNAYSAEQLDKLQAHDFAGRAIWEANKEPKGIIAQTLLYGRTEARKRVLSQKRAQVRSKSGFRVTRGA